MMVIGYHCEVAPDYRLLLHVIYYLVWHSTMWAAKITINSIYLLSGTTMFLSSGQKSSIISRLLVKKSHETYSNHELKILQITTSCFLTLLSVK